MEKVRELIQKYGTNKRERGVWGERFLSGKGQGKRGGGEDLFEPGGERSSGRKETYSSWGVGDKGIH